MHQAFRKSFLPLAICLGLSAPLAGAQTFQEIHQELPYTPIQPLLAADVTGDGDRELVVFGADDQGVRHLLLYTLSEDAKELTLLDDVIVPNQFHSFDIERNPTGNRAGLIFKSARELARYQRGEGRGGLVKIADIQSILAQDAVNHLARGNLVVDLDGDDYLDLKVPDFNVTHFYQGQPDGSFVHTRLPIPAQMVAEYGRVTYSDPNIAIVDATGDGRTDVVYIKDGQLNVFAQSANGAFDKELTVNINADINGVDWWNKRDANGEEFDQSQLSYRKLDKLRDINNDGWPDMVVRYTRSSGVLDRSNDYEIYLGKGLIDRVSYGDTPSSVIRSEGTLTGLDFVDIDRDGRSEVTLAGFDIGLGQIIGALLSGSIDQDVYLYRLDDNDSFGNKPAAAHTVDLKFSLTKGQSGSAIVKLADVDGDGVKDLLLSKDSRSLRIYAGQREGAPFDRKVQSFKTHLPEDGEPVNAADINLDGKDDLLIRYGRLDKPAEARLIKILLAQ